MFGGKGKPVTALYCGSLQVSYS